MAAPELNPVLREELQNYLDNTSSPRNITRMILTVLTLISSPFCIPFLYYSYCAEIGVYWLVLPLSALAMWIMGWGRDYGKKAPPVCVRDGRYTCVTIRCKEKIENTKGKAPYLLRGLDGGLYECPRFLDYRNAREGDSYLAVFAGGKAYAFSGETSVSSDLTDPAYNTLVPEDAPDFSEEILMLKLK